MTDPIVFDVKPIATELKAGEEYHWCSCGRSGRQPFCDGSHRGTGLSPKGFTAKENGEAYLCQCKQTANPPFCDGTHAGIPADQVGKEFALESSADGRLEAAIDVLKGKLVKRKISLKAISGGEIKPAAGGRVQTLFTLTQGIPQDAAKELSKAVRDSKLKVQAQIQADQVRVTGKKRDDLQQVMALLREGDFGAPLQFTNFRD